MRSLATLLSRAYWFGSDVKARALRRLVPSRMRVIPYSWPLVPEICPCDLDFCDYLKDRNVRGRSIFHFGTGGHHVVGLRNLSDGLDNDILAITASPTEHAQYVKEVIRNPRLGSRYKVLFADLYNLRAAALPTFDVVTLFHLCEYAEPASSRRVLDDAGVLTLFLARSAPNARLLFYRRSSASALAGRLVERAIADRHISPEEEYKTLRVFRVSPRA